MQSSASGLGLLLTSQLTHIAPADVIILAMFFALVIFIGFYVKGSSNTSEDFFPAGREMSAWIAGLSFVSANLGSLELMGWAGAAYQYGISCGTLVLDRGNPCDASILRHAERDYGEERQQSCAVLLDSLRVKLI